MPLMFFVHPLCGGLEGWARVFGWLLGTYTTYFKLVGAEETANHVNNSTSSGQNITPGQDLISFFVCFVFTIEGSG